MAVKGKKTAARPKSRIVSDMDGEGSWWSRNWHSMLVLAMVVLLAFLLRVVFVYDASAGIYLSGGPDAAYHQRIIEHIVSTGTHLFVDPLLNYPVGGSNPNPPLMDWTVSLGGMFLYLFGIPIAEGALYSLSLHTAVAGALSCIPVFLIAREAFGRRAGIVAALLFSISAGAIGGSVMSNGDHDAFVMFFILWSLYFLLISLRKIKDERFVQSYDSRQNIKSGLRSYYQNNRLSLAYAVMGGICLGAVELVWKGFTYITVIILVYFVIQLLLDRFRGKDSLAVTMVVSVMLFTGLLVGAPYYLILGVWKSWFDIPALMAVVALIVGLAFSFTRDRPWTLVLPAFIVAGLMALALMSVLAPEMLASILSGQGYFGGSKLYSTIAEAQSPSFSRLATNFGWLTIWLSFSGVAYMLYRLPKSNSPAQIMIMVWVTVAIFMASSANRFIFNGAPAFAISASMLAIILMDKIDIREYFQDIRASGFKGMFRKIIRPAPFITVLAAVFLIMTPNVLFAVDASMPYSVKSDYDQQIYDSMPSFLRPSDYSAYQYLGTSGFSVNTPANYYWLDAWDWLSEQDAQSKAADRPAFLSWWDYGHEAAAFGDHPAVADNFQNGYNLAGTYFTSQSEAESIALLIARVMESRSGQLTGSIPDILNSSGLDVANVEAMLFNGKAYVASILANPSIYGAYTSDLSAENARYIALSHYLSSELSQASLVDLYHELRTATGNDISYVGIDYRMFPLHYGDNNIFAALALLSDHQLDQYGIPSDFYELYAQLANGAMVPLSSVTTSQKVVDLQIVYNENLYSSMLWRIFAGYTPADLGLSQQGVAGVSGSLADYSYMPAWNLNNYRAVYMTAFYNPYSDYANHSDAWQYISYDEGLDLYQRIQDGEMTGVVDLSPVSMMRQGVMMVQYYDGVIINGTVETVSGVGAENVRVTVFDEYGIPHMSVLTDHEGFYEIMAPFGEVTLAFTYGDLNPISLVGAETLATEKYNFTYEQAMRMGDYQIVKDLSVDASAITGKVYIVQDADEALPGAEITVNDGTGNISTVSDVNGNFNLSGLMPGTYKVTVTYDGHLLYTADKNVSLSDSVAITVAVMPASVSGVLRDHFGNVVVNQDLKLFDVSNANSSVLTTDNNGAFSFSDLLAGAYRLEMNNSNFTVGIQSFNLISGEDKVIGLEIEGAVAVNGTVRDTNNEKVPHALLIFSRPGQNQMAISDAGGNYQAILAVDEYSLYASGVKGGIELVNLSRFIPSNVSAQNITLAAAKTVTGKVTSEGIAVPGAQMTYRSVSGATVSYVSSQSGYYRASLPVGSYELYVQSDEGAYWSDVDIIGNATRNIALVAAHSVSGILWYDANGDSSRGDLEGLGGEVVRVSDGYAIIQLLSDAEGAFSLMLPQQMSYSLASSLEGFHDCEIVLTTLNADVVRDMQNIPLNQTVSGTVNLSGVPVPGLTLKFEAVPGSGALNTTALTAVDGSYSVALRPGDYTLTVRQNVLPGNESLIYTGQESLRAILNGDPQSVDLEVRQEALTTISTNHAGNSIMIAGLDTLYGSLLYQEYLPVGNHSVYAVNEALNKAYLGRNNTPALNNTINVTTVEAYELSGKLYHEGILKTFPATVSFNSSTGAEYSVLSSLGAYKVLLPNGVYDVNARYVGLDGGYYYLYEDSESVTVSGSTSSDMDYTRSWANSTVNIVVLNPDGNDTKIRFQANDPTAVDRNVNITGSGTVDLAPGTYTVYAYNHNDRAYLGTATIQLEEELDLTINLEGAFELGGVTWASSSAVPSEVRITQGEARIDLTSDLNGSFSLLLPIGYYDIHISSTVAENGMNVDYEGAFAHSLRQTVSMDYRMLREDVRSVSMEVTGPGSVTAGQTYTYTLKVVNNGNSAETITLGSNSWNMLFNGNGFDLDYGATSPSETVTFELTVPANAIVEHAAVKVLALAADGTILGSATLSLNVTPSPGLDLAYLSAQPTDGSSYLYAVKVDNTGNVALTYDLGIDQAALAAVGWQASLVDSEGVAINNVTVSAYSSETVHVKLVPLTSSPNRQPSVTFTAESSAHGLSEALNFNAEMPNLAVMTGTVDVTGPNVFDSEAEMPTLTLALIAASVLAIMLLIMMGLSRGVFSRKKR